MKNVLFIALVSLFVTSQAYSSVIVSFPNDSPKSGLSKGQVQRALSSGVLFIRIQNLNDEKVRVQFSIENDEYKRIPLDTWKSDISPVPNIKDHDYIDLPAKMKSKKAIAFQVKYPGKYFT